MKTKLIIIMTFLLAVGQMANAIGLPDWKLDYTASDPMRFWAKVINGRNANNEPNAVTNGYFYAFVGSECRMAKQGCTQQNPIYFPMTIQLRDAEVPDSITLYYFKETGTADDYAIYVAKVSYQEYRYPDEGERKGSLQNPFILDISVLTPIDIPEISINITDAKWATLTLPFDMTLTEPAFTAYTCSEHDATGKLTLTEVEKDGELNTLTLTACTPYLLYSETPYSTTVSAAPRALTDTIFTVGMLTGNVTPVKLQGGDYGMQKLGDKVAFYPLAAGATATLPANRVYISKESATAPQQSFFFDIEETGIDHLIGNINHRSDGKYLERGRLIIIKSGKRYTIAGVSINN